METTMINVGKLRRRDDARPIDRNIVMGLAESMREVGIINPLRVRPTRIFQNGAETDGFEVIAGNHRLEASQHAGMNDLPCVIVNDGDLKAELAMIDENLMRADLSPAQTASQTTRRKEIYEALHPGTRLGENQHTRVRKNCEPTNRFTAETAKATGRHERSVQLDAKRGRDLGDDLKLIEGTSLDKGKELDALAKLPPAERQDLIRRARQGERVSARPKVAADPLNDMEAQEAQVASLMSAWNKASAEAREEFLLRIERPVMDANFGAAA